MTKNIMKTFSATPKDITRKWYVIDATDLILGRMSVVIADYLRGKHKVYYTPNMDCGDYIIVINADKVALTGNKDLERFYWHTGYMGGIKYRTKGKMLKETPERLIENSVRRMMNKEFVDNVYDPYKLIEDMRKIPSKKKKYNLKKFTE